MQHVCQETVNAREEKRHKAISVPQLVPGSEKRIYPVRRRPATPDGPERLDRTTFTLLDPCFDVPETPIGTMFNQPQPSPACPQSLKLTVKRRGATPDKPRIVRKT